MSQAPLGITFCDPAAVLRALSVQPGMIVADFGAGSGYFSFEFAKAVGSEGRVYALDVLPSALEAITSRAKTLGVSNVTAQRVNLERPNGSGLGAAMVDWVIMKDVLLQNAQKDIILAEANRILKPGGHVLIVEWDPRESAVGPEKHLRIAPDALRALVDAAGLSIIEEPNVGGYHYAFVAKKP